MNWTRSQRTRYLISIINMDIECYTLNLLNHLYLQSPHGPLFINDKGSTTFVLNPLFIERFLSKVKKTSWSRNNKILRRILNFRVFRKVIVEWVGRDGVPFMNEPVSFHQRRFRVDTRRNRGRPGRERKKEKVEKP